MSSFKTFINYIISFTTLVIVLSIGQPVKASAQTNTQVRLIFAKTSTNQIYRYNPSTRSYIQQSSTSSYFPFSQNYLTCQEILPQIGDVAYQDCLNYSRLRPGTNTALYLYEHTIQIIHANNSQQVFSYYIPYFYNFNTRQYEFMNENVQLIPANQARWRLIRTA